MFIEITAHILTYILIDITYVSVPDCTAFYLTFPPNSIKLISFCRFVPFKVQYIKFYTVVSPIYCFVCSRLRLSFRPSICPLLSLSPQVRLTICLFARLPVCQSARPYISMLIKPRDRLSICPRVRACDCTRVRPSFLPFVPPPFLS